MSRRHGYAPDEFDEAAAARVLDAAHRPPRRHRLLPWVAILVLAPLAAWAVFTFGVRSGVLPAPAEALDDLRARTTSGTAPQRAAQREEPALDVDRTVAVTLLDGSARGVAAEGAQALLKDAGYENVTTGVYRSTEPRGTTVFVRSADEMEVGEDIARLLVSETGGSTPEVVESADAAASVPVVAVLR